MQQIKGISRKGAYEIGQIGQSLLFDPGDDPRLTKTIATSGNQKTITISFWFKRGNLGLTNTRLFSSKTSNSDEFEIFLNSSDQLSTFFYSGSYPFYFLTTQVFRDPSAWYHYCLKYDSTPASPDSSDCALYINGVQVTAFGIETYPSQNLALPVNKATANVTIGDHGGGLGSYVWDGYIAEWHSIDGTALGPEHFALTDSKGVYNPIRYTGTYGTNGFYLPFEASDIGADASGKGNNFTPSGLTSDSVVADSPANNFATLNPLLKWYGSQTYSEGNLKSNNTSGYNANVSTIGASSGKWYFEWRAGASTQSIGVIGNKTVGWWGGQAEFPSNESGVFVYYGYTGRLNIDGSYSTTLSTFGTDDIIGTALNLDDSEITFYKNGVVQNSGTPIALSGDITNSTIFNFGTVTYVATVAYSGWANFGQRSWAYAPPSGYQALCTQNLPDPLVNPKEHFKAVTYTGTGNATIGAQDITGLKFQPDMLWIKARNQAYQHTLRDSIRGSTKSISSNRTYVDRLQPDSVTSFNADGWSMGADSSSMVNYVSSNYVGWAFKGGPAVTNNDGSIPSEVSANKDMGFSVVKWNMSAQTLRTIGHGLGKIPDLIITKKLTGDQRWEVHSSPTGVDDGLVLNNSSAAAFQPTWGSFQPTDKVFMFTQTTGDYIAYCFTNTEMLQVGSYVGNGLDDGPMVSLPMKPAYFMVKAIDTPNQSWTVWDNARSPYNLSSKLLYPDSDVVEGDFASLGVDLLSNGVKIRGDHGYTNISGIKYLYLAISEQPFKHARGR